MRHEVERYLKESVDIMIVGGDEGGNFAYDYRLDDLRTLLERALGPETAAELTSALPQHMAVFHFPFGERDNVLALGAFFHEVGHQIDREFRGISARTLGEFLKSNDATIRAAVREPADRVISEAFGQGDSKDQRSLDDEKAEVIRETFVKQIQAVLHRWSMEFCADLIATQILGPAYALVVVHSPALLSNLETHSDSHPATLLRLKTVLDLLGSPTAQDYFATPDGRTNSAGLMSLLESWRARCSGSQFGKMPWHQASVLGSNGALRALAVELGVQLAGQIRAVLEKEVQPDYYTPAQFSRDLQDLLPVLREGITINERVNYATRQREVNSISSIFNAGWACYLQEPSQPIRERLQRLLRKSIELSQIQATLPPTGAHD